ncbi:GntR family transcriptional regulator [Oryzobacter telluris]|uniref:GntR family transcriptional regulator n=1 Tax=Oryzobacter telluris TaxID=3149179 RepID=UPI00370CFBF8
MADTAVAARRITDGARPKHAQLRDVLAAMCATELEPDTAIPSERELMETYAVSRATVRRAIETLIAEGLLRRAQGKGTFVARPRVESHLHLASFTEDMRRRGLEPSTRVVRADAAEPPADVARFLGLGPGRRAWRLERVRLAGGEPMAFESGWYAAELLPDLDRHDLTGSLYTIFSEVYGVAVDTAEQTVWAEVAEERLARHLQVAVGSPVMAFDRQGSSQGRPLERAVSHYRGDRYQLHVSLDSTMPHHHRKDTR